MPKGLFTLNAHSPRTVTWLPDDVDEQSVRPENIDNLDYVIRNVPDHVYRIIESIPPGDMQQIDLVLRNFI